MLGSRGSVVPTFERQIEQGGPVTVTHRDMTRYFMSLSEAVSLIIQAAALTEGGDIFLLDMGQQIRIDDLARRLIRLRGLRPEVDIPIVYTGVQPGEKMHEELIGDGEVQETTSHSHIFRVRSREGGRGRMERGKGRMEVCPFSILRFPFSSYYGYLDESGDAVPFFGSRYLVVAALSVRNPRPIELHNFYFFVLIRAIRGKFLTLTMRNPKEPLSEVREGR